MPGPPPKPAELRQRTNKTATHRTFAVVEPPIEGTPELPPHRGRWHPQTVAFWESVWASPMRGEFLRSDLFGLYVLASAVETYWRAGRKELAVKVAMMREIRAYQTEFGLTPIARRRLQWEVRRVEDAEAKRPKPRPVEPAADPRQVLRAVQ